MRPGSNRRARQKLKVARIHARTAAARVDFLHKTTTEIIRRTDVIANLTALPITALPQIEYKAAWYGR
ncbi:MAG TPA: transposase [Candidatus Competibacteraceae bacterium]|nr:transposase [Candidatus Competibacteraceae bacterium]